MIKVRKEPHNMHGISEDDNVIAVRKPTWHGLDETLAEAPSRAEAEAKVHDYDVLREDVYRKVIGFDENGLGPITEYQLIEDLQINVHSETDYIMAGVPRDRVDPQPSQVWDIADVWLKLGAVVETAGTFNHGSNMWILLMLPEPITIAGDPKGESLAYMALQNAYVPGKGLRAQATNIRIECQNRSNLADMLADAQGANISLAHTLNLMERVEEIKEKMEVWRTGIDEWKLAKEYMATQKVTASQMNWFIEQFIPAPAELLTSDRVKDNIENDRSLLALELFNGFNDGIIGTSLGLFEAASSYETHVRKAMTPLTRFKRSMLTPDTVLFDAHELALEAANV